MLIDEYILIVLFCAICIFFGCKYLKPVNTHTVTAGPGDYVIGKNVPPGKYDLVADSGAGDFCILEYNAIDWHNNQNMGKDSDKAPQRFRNVVLKKGDRLQINGSLHLLLQPATAIKNITLELLEPGNYKIGSDLLPGTYNLEAMSGEGKVFTAVEGQEGNPFFQEMAKEKKDTASTYKNLSCTEGTILFIRGNLTIRLTAAPKSKRWRWLSE